MRNYLERFNLLRFHPRQWVGRPSTRAACGRNAIDDAYFKKGPSSWLESI
jgi:hypothetical protein